MIGNRGFFDHSIEEMTEWAKAYDGLGIGAADDAIREAALLMPAINWDNNDPVEQQLDPIEKRFYEADEQTPGAIAALIRKSPEVAFAALQ
jgi:hypothetical protein